jgi:hypothetical protein
VLSNGVVLELEVARQTTAGEPALMAESFFNLQATDSVEFFRGRNSCFISRPG